ncbi:Protein TRANSPORT INHIBITOR RESPONSE 1 [Capsicum annuum]|uniref:Protein TRANSPORT INHIBITOR RESPONSE 1 n=1 Tax=Capsicum annuum TaxID=4072 RepID=A0A2G2Z790_CAPAN|nr:Protein TRANSPORT INHIBITOR RESPONSE 1 [Capsicum annuum]
MQYDIEHQKVRVRLNPFLSQYVSVIPIPTHASRFSSMIILHVHAYDRGSVSITHATRQMIGEILLIASRKLRELDLGESEVENLSGHWLSHFPDSCTSLVSLNIACLASEVSFSALERLVARSPHLRTLRLNRAVSIEKLPKLLRHASQLVEFGCNKLKGLSGFREAVPAYFPTIYPVHAKLTSLNLSYATVQIPDLGKIVSHCHNLQRLWVLDYVEVSSLEEIANSCKELQELRVFSSDPFAPGPNVSLTEQGLVAISVDCLKLHENLRKLEIRDWLFGDEAPLANAAKLETMQYLWMSNCSVSFEACKLLAQKFSGLNVEVIDERGHPNTRQESCPIEKLYIYRTVSGRRFNTPSFVWIIAEDASPTPYSNGNCSLASS